MKLEAYRPTPPSSGWCKAHACSLAVLTPAMRISAARQRICCEDCADRFRLKTTAVMAIVHWRGSIAVMLKRKCMNFVLRNAGVLLNEMSKLSPRNEGFVLNVLHCFPSALPVPES